MVRNGGGVAAGVGCRPAAAMAVEDSPLVETWDVGPSVGVALPDDTEVAWDALVAAAVERS